VLICKETYVVSGSGDSPARRRRRRVVSKKKKKVSLSSPSLGAGVGVCE